MAAYHWEARRRQRVFDRKQEARMRIAKKMEEEERLRLEEDAKLEKEKRQMEDARRREREEHMRQRGEGGIQRSFGSRNSRQIPSTQRDLRQQQKVLRDHGLVMGHVNEEFLS